MVQVMWALCVYLEAVSVLPQLRMMQNAKVPRPARSSSCRAHSAQTAAHGSLADPETVPGLHGFGLTALTLQIVHLLRV